MIAIYIRGDLWHTSVVPSLIHHGVPLFFSFSRALEQPPPNPCLAPPESDAKVSHHTRQPLLVSTTPLTKLRRFSVDAHGTRVFAIVSSRAVRLQVSVSNGHYSSCSQYSQLTASSCFSAIPRRSAIHCRISIS